MLVMTIVFGKLAEMPSGGAPYPILVLCGVLPWQFFSAAVSESGNSLVSNTSLISKVYFPRMAVPASTYRNEPGRFLHFSGSFSCS